jgi:hypothetical protein
MGTAFAVALVVIYMLVVWQFGNFMITLEPPTNAKAVIIIGRVLDAQEFITASKNGTPLAYSCTVKSTSNDRVYILFMQSQNNIFVQIRII